MRSGHPSAAAIAKLVLALGVSLGGVACGAATPSASARLRPPCSQRASDALARSVALAASSITASRFTANNGEAGCRFTARGPTGRALDVVVETNSAPQAYYTFNRTVVEYSQSVIWFHVGERAYPRPIAHLGLGADWFPAENQLMGTDAVRVITIVVSSSAGVAGRERIAENLARSYLPVTR